MRFIAEIGGCLSAAFALLVWGVTFACTRALLVDFSALEIMVVRFAMAWVVLWGMEVEKVGGENEKGYLDCCDDGWVGGNCGDQ